MQPMWWRTVHCRQFSTLFSEMKVMLGEKILINHGIILKCSACLSVTVQCSDSSIYPLLAHSPAVKMRHLSWPMMDSGTQALTIWCMPSVIQNLIIVCCTSPAHESFSCFGDFLLSPNSNTLFSASYIFKSNSQLPLCWIKYFINYFHS